MPGDARGGDVVSSQGGADLTGVMRCLQLCITIMNVMHNGDMRTTITMDEETAKIATEYARGRGLSLSKAISELIQRGTRRRARIKYVDGWPMLDCPTQETAYNRAGKRAGARVI